MPRGRPQSLVHYLRTRAGTPKIAETDRQLLIRFATSGDEEAFALVVGRYARLVMGVCRRVLGHEQDAEDAFQATFLHMVRKASSVAWHDSAAGWLYKTALRAATSIRASGRRRRTHEEHAPVPPLTENPALAIERQELAGLIEKELSHLPERYRLALVLCDLEGVSRSEAARQLGWKEGTVAGRLARARLLLQRRLPDGASGFPPDALRESDTRHRP